MTLLDLPSTIALPPAPTLAPPSPNRSLAPIDPFSPPFALCRQITRAQARNFYLGLRLAPEPKRSALLAIYAWMRHADDLADAPHDSPDTRSAALLRLRARTTAAFDAPEAPPPNPDHPDAATAWWPAVVRTIHAYALPASIFTDTLDALQADAAGVNLSTTHDLARYCDRVAGTVALACVTIWGVRRPELTPRAHHLAILRARAVQLTNILRDLREDLTFLPRRSYLPRDSYLHHRLSPDGLLSWDPPDRSSELLDEWISQTRALYHASRDLESLIDPSCARVSWALSAVYRALLESIARHPARVARERLSVPRARKLSIALTGWLGVGLPG